MATPHVSGALGLLLAQEGQNITVSEVKERLMKTSSPVRAYRRKLISGGRLNVYNLLTNTRPGRNEPDPSAWKTMAIDTIESEHPYKHGVSFEKVIEVPNAKYVRLKIERLDLEVGYDFLTVETTDRQEIDKMSGTLADAVSDYVEGNKLVLRFTSDRSVNGWGYKITEVQYIP